MGDGIRRDRQVVGPQLVGILIPPTKGGEVDVDEKQTNDPILWHIQMAPVLLGRRHAHTTLTTLTTNTQLHPHTTINHKSRRLHSRQIRSGSDPMHTNGL